MHQKTENRKIHMLFEPKSIVIKKFADFKIEKLF